MPRPEQTMIPLHAEDRPLPGPRTWPCAASRGPVAVLEVRALLDDVRALDIVSEPP